VVSDSCGGRARAGLALLTRAATAWRRAGNEFADAGRSTSLNCRDLHDEFIQPAFTGAPALWLDASSLAAVPPSIAMRSFVAEPRRIHDVIHRVLVPWNRMVGADHELARADFGGKVPQHLGGKYECVEIKRLQIFRRFFLQRDAAVAVPWRDAAGVIERGAYEGR